MNEILKIKKDNNLLQFKYNPEVSGNIGIVKYDLNKEEVVEIIPSTSDTNSNYYAYKALWYLVNLLKENKVLETEYKQVWY